MWCLDSLVKNDSSVCRRLVSCAVVWPNISIDDQARGRG